MAEPRKPKLPTQAEVTRSLVGRLVRAAALWALPLLALTAFALSWLYRNSTYQIIEEPLVETVTSLLAHTDTIPQSDGETIIDLNREPLDPRFQRALSGLYWEILSRDEQTKQLRSEINSRSLYGATIKLPVSAVERLMTEPGLELRTSATGADSESLRVVARSIILPNMDRPVIMVAGINQAPANRAVRRFALLAIGLVAALTLGLIGAIILQVRLGLQPLFDLRERVADVREGRQAQVLGKYPQEIAPLALELNSLIAHNRDIVERARTHVSNLAHALKTPLAVLQNDAAAKDPELAASVTKQTENMLAQVNQHLARARAAARAQTTTARSDIAKAVNDLTRTLEKIYRDKSVAVDLALAENVGFRGEKTDLDDMIGNLLDNAFKWSAGRVSARVESDPERSDFVRIIIGDDGPGISQELRDQARLRGERLDETMPGTGFGLAIVDDLARAYQGELILGKSSWGGLEAILRLPRVQDGRVT
ncbi:sensor histidine kinase [Robiginitomaculum antarcticum]|uniref:sensor histidine kinase n=1 Tax=Robiginitomaculum antarcticum TaxID=437507 RepID=UPI00037F6732|nr:sensor histidine kinase [Robiginitomaculum antarcticum]